MDEDFRILKTLTAVLKAIPQHEFQKRSGECQHRWAKYIAAQGEYFKEDDPSQLVVNIQVC
jgi:hypothetical protein